MSAGERLKYKSDNLSLAWGKLFVKLAGRGPKELPAWISVTSSDGELPPEDSEIRSALDAAIEVRRASGKNVNSVEVSAMVVFPYRDWLRKGKPPHDEFRPWCIEKLAPRLHNLDCRNRNGVYFERMMEYTGLDWDGQPDVVDQIAHVIDVWRHYRSKRRRPRQSSLQMICFDPLKDHSINPRSTFPCLHQVSVSYIDRTSLALSAYYSKQYIFDRAYGNYLGLCRLGAYLAHEFEMPFMRFDCFIASAELQVNKGEVASLRSLILRKIAEHEGQH